MGLKGYIRNVISGWQGYADLFQAALRVEMSNSIGQREMKLHKDGKDLQGNQRKQVRYYPQGKAKQPKGWENTKGKGFRLYSNKGGDIWD